MEKRELLRAEVEGGEGEARRGLERERRKRETSLQSSQPNWAHPPSHNQEKTGRKPAAVP